MDGRVLQLLQLLFEAPGDRLGWFPFLETLGKSISPDCRVVSVAERGEPEPVVVLGVAGENRVVSGRLPRWGDGQSPLDSVQLGRVFDLPPPERYSEHAVVQALLAPEGLEFGPGLGVAVAHEPGLATIFLLALPQRPGWEPSAEDRSLLTELAPFLVRAVRLHQRMLGANALTSLLDHLALGVLLLYRTGRVAYANRSAAELLGIEPGLAERAVRAAHEPGNAELCRAVLAVTEGEDRLLRHPVDGRPLHVIATSIEWPSPQGAGGEFFARAIFIGDPKLSSTGPSGLAEAYGLTPAEARLAWLLAGDLTLVEAARELGIATSTARTVLKRLLSKTGTRRQASLVRMLLAGPGQLRDTERPAGRRASVRRRRKRP